MLVLVRHGESTANAAGLLLGRSDVALTALGREQARSVGAGLGPFSRLVSSPLRRALDTADELSANAQTGAAVKVDVKVEVDDRWIEVDYGEYEGQPLGEVPAEVWRHWRSDPTFRPPGGESLAEVGVRVRAACTELMARPGDGARSEDGDVVVVSHVSPIKAAVAWALGADDGLAWRLHLSTGSVTVIGWSSGGPLLHAFNRLPGAAARAQP